MRRAMIAGNWKMQGSSENNEKLVSQLVCDDRLSAWSNKLDMVVCPPFVYLNQIHHLLQKSPITLGAQDVSLHSEGAYTGQVSAAMLIEQGCAWVIVGHSERRQMCGETDAIVAEKIQQALKLGLKPILCVGETQEEREANQTESVVGRQLAAVLSACQPEALATLVVAYEPIWAIGTGLTATPAEAQSVHAFLRKQLANYDEGLAKSTRILYGGSVKPENAAGLFEMPDIDGALVGGASLVAASFLGICAAQFDAL